MPASLLCHAHHVDAVIRVCVVVLVVFRSVEVEDVAFASRKIVHYAR